MITADPNEARAAREQGVDVVLVVRPGTLVDEVGAPGRLAVLVGDPTDPAVERAAADMESELFGAGGG